jgi:predicted transposase YbfD/YdcC
MDEPPLSDANRSSLTLLRERLARLDDHRQAGTIKHQLADVLGCALCAMICGFGDFCAMATFTRYRLDWLRHFLPLENGAPSHDTFRNVFMAIDADQFAAVLTEWCSVLAGKHVAIDGKALRGTFDRDAGKCLVHLLRAWVDDVSLSVGQVACAHKRNEIEAIPRLLDSLQLQGATVTIDAAGCQSAIAEQIDTADAHYILALKGNQGRAHDTVRKHLLSFERPADAGTEECAHGRYEKRECWVEDDLSFFGKSWKWQGITCVARIRRETCRPGARGTDSAEATVEEHYYLCSVAPDAETILSTVRRHWGIENRCHWTLDVVFGDDACSVRDGNAARNLSTLRDMAMHMLRKHPDAGTLPNKRQRALLDPNFRAEVVSNFHA